MTTKPTTVQRAVLNTAEAQQFLGISKPTLFRLLRDGKLPHLRIGRLIKFRREDLDEYLRSAVTTEWKNTP